jgi:hypothetical protein
MTTTDNKLTKVKFTGLKVFTNDEVYNLLVSALEGGSNYWYMIDDTNVPRRKQDIPFVDQLLQAIQAGIEVKISDSETDEVLGALTRKSWANAERLMLAEHRGHAGDVLSGHDDAATGDVFFQLAVMGKVVYG